MKKAYIFFFLSSLLMFSCQKAELKKPTRLNFTFDINKDPGNNPLKINSGEINLLNFNISGDRIEGEGIVFSRPFGAGLSTDLNGSSELEEMDFDIPQGEYISIDLNFTIGQNQTEPAMILTGTYKPTAAPTVGLRFEFLETQIFQINGEDELGNNIIMDKELGKKGRILFDPVYWFQTLTTNQLDNATITDTQGQDLIIISASSNIILYEIVVNRLANSNKAIFK